MKDAIRIQACIPSSRWLNLFLRLRTVKVQGGLLSRGLGILRVGLEVRSVEVLGMGSCIWAQLIKIQLH